MIPPGNVVPVDASAVRTLRRILREQRVADRLDGLHRHQRVHPADGFGDLLGLELRGVAGLLALCRSRLRAAGGELVLDPPHHEVRAGLAVLEDRVLEAAQPLVDRAEVEVDLRVLAVQLERLQERRLRFLEAAELVVDEAEVVEERVGLGALRDELAVDLLRLFVLLLLEVDEPEEVQDLLVARPQEVRLLQLALRVLVAPLVVVPLALVEVGEEQPLVEGGPGRGVTHSGVRGRSLDH